MCKRSTGTEKKEYHYYRPSIPKQITSPDPPKASSTKRGATVASSLPPSNQPLKPISETPQSKQYYFFRKPAQQEKIPDPEEVLLKQKEIKAKYNNISAMNSKTPQDLPIFKFSIGRGNNSNLVRRVMEKRNKDWKEVPNSLYNFKWAPVSQ